MESVRSAVTRATSSEREPTPSLAQARATSTRTVEWAAGNLLHLSDDKVSTVSIPSSVQAFWRDFAAVVGHDPAQRFYEAFHFDDNAPTADELAALVLAGTKRATAGLLWAFEAESKPIPKVGDLSVVTLFSGKPVCVIETMSIQIVPFSEVDAAFAATEGEGDGSLAYWQRAHIAFFGRECQRLGREFRLDAPVVCETFAVVYRGAGGGA